MAKVYSWEITKSNVYAYIIDPDNIEGMGVYIGPELYGNDLNKVVNWVSSCSNEQYKEQFDKIKSKCKDFGYNVIFENVETYLNVKASRENLRGPAGRGISHIRLIKSDNITRKNTYAIYYDDDTHDTIEIQNGVDGKDGINGEPGTNGFDGVSSKFIMIYSVGNEKDGNIIPPEQPTGGTYNFITNKIEFNVGEQNLEEQGWGTDNNLNGVIYMSSRTFTSSKLSTNNEWSIPVRISGEQGEQGKSGVSQNQMYSLGTAEVCFANDAENSLPINNAIDNKWLYSDEIPDTNIIHVSNYNDISNFLNKDNLGRIICDDGNKKYYLIHRRGNIEWFGVSNLDTYEGEDLYVWTIQGSDKYNENNILEGVSWCKPFKLQGVKGPAGSRGIPGVSQNQMYSLGTAEVCFGIFKEKYIPEILHNGYKWLYSDEIPDTNIIKVTNLTSEQIKQQYAKKEYLGRVIENTTTESNIKTNYLIFLTNSSYDCEIINNDVDYLYIWCIQGKDIYEKDNNGDDIITGVSWCKPFKLQGVNGLPGKDGSKGQITYPMGVYNPNEVYTTTSKKAPYVMDPDDGLYYVLNKEMTWVGEFPTDTDYKTIVVHPNDADNDATVYTINTIPIIDKGKYIRVHDPVWKETMYFKWNGNEYIMASKFKYSTDGTGNEGTWLTTEQGSGITPSVDYTNNSSNGRNCWERFESFNALYASVGIIENGTIGSAVYNGKYMFSQQGINSDGVKSNDYEEFDSKDPYNENNSFRPNICIDFENGEMWVSRGNIQFKDGDILLNGLIKKNKTVINENNYQRFLKEKYLKQGTKTRGATGGNTGEDTGDDSPDLVVKPLYPPTTGTCLPYGTGVTTEYKSSDKVKILDIEKTGSFIEFNYNIDNTLYTEITLPSIPTGYYEISSSEMDTARSLIGNNIHIINRGDANVFICSYLREYNDTKYVPTFRCVPIGKNNFMTLSCVVRSLNNRERIYWEYEVGETAKDTEYNEPFIVEKINPLPGSSYGNLCNSEE